MAGSAILRRLFEGDFEIGEVANYGFSAGNELPNAKGARYNMCILTIPRCALAKPRQRVADDGRHEGSLSRSNFHGLGATVAVMVLSEP